MRYLDKKLDDAINRANLEEVKILIAKGADIEYRDPFGCTALMNASWVAEADIVDFLLTNGADWKARNNDNQTALDMMYSIGHNEYGHNIVIEILETVSQKI